MAHASKESPGNEPARAAADGHHSSEDALIAARRAKAERVRGRGENPFANDLTAEGGLNAGLPLSPLGEVRSHFTHRRDEAGRYAEVEPERFHVAGRVLFLRSFGAMSFIRLRDRTDELQLLCEQSSLGEGYEHLEDLDLGDFVEAVGHSTQTKKGELSIAAERLRLVSKAYRPLPTKTSFRDVESRYRMRYVDLVANPAVLQRFRARSLVVSALRAFLDERSFVEVETPTMHSIVGGAAARPFVTHHNTLDLDLYLRIAPELYLKRLVVGGIERVYEIARCYRNEGVSTRHNPEFTMLEFYQAFATYHSLMGLTEELLRFVDARLAAAMPAEHAAWAAERSFTLERFDRVTMHAAIAEALAAAGLPDTLPAQIAGEAPPIKAWAAEAKGRGRDIDWSGYRGAMLRCPTAGDRLFCTYEYLAEPFLQVDYRAGERSVPVFITDYPFEVSPLARRKDDRPELVDRFELFVHGQELCNAFSELNDPDDQAGRFAEQLARKGRGDEEAMGFDHDYVRALEFGLPPCAGFGMGVDRLTMMLTAAPSIRDVILFPLLRPEAGERA